MPAVRRWLKLSHRQHSLKRLPHEHTSYGLLAVLLFVASIPMSVFTVNALSVDHPAPQSGSIGLTGSVAGSPPKIAAHITSPSDSSRFTTSPVPLAGTCSGSTLIEIYKNDIFAGSAPCDNGKFSLDVDLLIGANRVVAKTYDNLNQPGPDSDAITLTYDPLTAASSPTESLYFGGAQLVLNTDAVFRGSFPGQSFGVPISILGGTAPYAVNVTWGDSATNLISRDSSVTFSSTHAYKKPGTYQITIQATDAKGRVAFLTVAAIINGQPSVAAATGSASGTTTNESVNTLLLLWPLYTAAFGIVVSFWLGERREKRVLAKHGLLVAGA